MFPGNTHDDKPQFNVFEYPIVARYVRFVPIRWNINIAMRVELYGCNYGRVSFDCVLLYYIIVRYAFHHQRDNDYGYCFILEGEASYFDGTSAISFNAHDPNSLYTTVDMLRFRMKTSSPEGVVFYASGNQGDHINLELSDGRLYVDVSLGITLT